MARSIRQIVDEAGDIKSGFADKKTGQAWFQRHEMERLAKQIVALEKELDEYNPIYNDHCGLED